MRRNEVGEGRSRKEEGGAKGTEKEEVERRKRKEEVGGIRKKNKNKIVIQLKKNCELPPCLSIPFPQHRRDESSTAESLTLHNPGQSPRSAGIIQAAPLQTFKL